MKLNEILVLPSQHHVMLTQQHINRSVAGIVPVSLDAATETQVIYSASSVTERKKGTVQDLQCVN
jgi:hypothetical protein